MPRRKRHYVYCKAGLHLLSESRVIKILKKAPLIRGRYVIRFCRHCRDVKNKEYYKRLTGPWHLRPKRVSYMKKYMKNRRLAKSLKRWAKRVLTPTGSGYILMPMPHTPKKHDRILIKISIEDKKEIQSSMENGELSDVTRVLLLMYARDPVLRGSVRNIRVMNANNVNWQHP